MSEVQTIETMGQQVAGLEDRAGKYLTFKLAEEEYGLEILKVREIMGLMPVTRVPQTPAFVRGVINLRGKVIPVVDLRMKFGMQSIEDTEETCIIVVDVTRKGQVTNMGIVVDRVEEVLDISGNDIEDTPSLGAGVNTDFILGMGKVGDKVKMLLDINRVLLSATSATQDLFTAERKVKEDAAGSSAETESKDTDNTADKEENN
ncbi:purine-binding chemotaxis protein CheW [bacterium]|nr:purine-binding chemotaxis protein CheW [bacterium]